MQRGAAIDPGILKARARLLADVRRFFDERNVLEVTTPVLGAYGASDLHLANLEVVLPGATAGVVTSGATGYLQTSPEYAMKRLLAAGAGSIYQICPAFRGGESGRRHRPEFTMLEWYRPGFSLAELIGEVDTLIRGLLPDLPPLGQVTYRALFEQATGVNPHRADLVQLRDAVARFGLDDGHIEQHDDPGCLGDYLDLLFSSLVEPDLDYVAVKDFPACQVALARWETDEEGEQVASRFEIYIAGMELANGYDELRHANVLRQRFNENNQMRQVRGLLSIDPDEALLEALTRMPACCGVAVGFDRLVMVAEGLDEIDQVIALGSDFH